MNHSLSHILVVYHSLRHLRLSMIYWRVHRTLKGAAVRLIEKAGLARAIFDRPLGEMHVSLVPPLSGRYHCEDIDLRARRFSFLRDVETLPAEPAAVRAAVARKPLLWQFHFGYHDYLLPILESRRDTPTANEVLDFVTDWAAAFPLHAAGARGSAWHPYVLSIRIESWVRLHALLVECGVAAEDARLRLLGAGVERMTRVLLRNLEKGTMANHLLRNVKALVFAGLYLDTSAGALARRLGLRLLDRELDEQILDDGCHFERSPMYHVSITNDVLDMAEAILLCESPVPERLAGAAARMTAFLERMRHPDGEIPFFNDSTSSFFLRTQEVLERGLNLMKEISPNVMPSASAAENPPTVMPSSTPKADVSRHGPHADISPDVMPSSPPKADVSRHGPSIRSALSGGPTRDDASASALSGGPTRDDASASALSGGPTRDDVVFSAYEGVPSSEGDPARISGLLVAENPRAWLVMDAGLVGPDYQPGHAHCDTLSFELSLDGKRFLTDTGVYHYRESAERLYSRSTEAHNTIEIDGAEQSEVWKSFRVGRRAGIRYLAQESRDGVHILRGAHDGYTRLQAGLLHERAMLLSRDWLLIVDWLHGTGAHRWRSFLHFQPEVSLQADAAAASFIARREETEAHVRYHGEGAARRFDSEYYPAFGEKLPRQSLVFEGSGGLPRMLATEIVFGAAAPELRVEGMQMHVAGIGAIASRLAKR